MKKLSLMITVVVALMSLKQNTISAGEVVATKEPIPVVITAETIEPEIIETTTYAEPEVISLGEFKLTAYCSCKKCCGKWAESRPLDEDGNEIVIGASGEVLTAGYSIAVDPQLISYGTTVMINGKEYEAQDCGGAIKNNRIDVYFNDHAEALEFGVQYAEIFIREE